MSKTSAMENGRRENGKQEHKDSFKFELKMAIVRSPGLFLGLQTLLRSHPENKIWCSKLSEISLKIPNAAKIIEFLPNFKKKKTPWTLLTFVINFHFFSLANIFFIVEILIRNFCMCFATGCGDFSLFEPAKLTIRRPKKNRLVAKLSETIGRVQHFCRRSHGSKDFSSSFSFAFNFLDFFKKTWEFSKQFFSHSDRGPRKLTPSNLKCSTKKSLNFSRTQKHSIRWENWKNLIENVLLVCSSAECFCVREKRKCKHELNFLFFFVEHFKFDGVNLLVWASIAVRKNCLENSRVILKWSRKWTPN